MMGHPSEPDDVPYWSADCRCGNFNGEQVDMMIDEARAEMKREIVAKLRERAERAKTVGGCSSVIAAWIEAGCP